MVAFFRTSDSVLLEIALRATDCLICKVKECDTDQSWLFKLDELGGIAVIEQLQRHSNENVYKLAYGIVQNHIGIEEGGTTDNNQLDSFDF